MLEFIQDSDMHELMSLAERENHEVFCPTHVILKEGKILGCMSINGLPLGQVFFSKELTGRDVLSLIEEGEKIQRTLGFKEYGIVVQEESPMFHLMPKMGYKSVGNVHLWVKRLN